jgi:ADP-ribose pyrophosphatase YjhB (NUDIX family)
MANNRQCTHAGGIVFRRLGDKIEYLLIGPAKERPGEWLLPKGHVENGEDCRATAVREVKEETGVFARVLAPMEISEIQLTKKKILVQYYLMEMIAQEASPERRRLEWVTFDEAIQRISHESNRILLQEAEKMRVLYDT